MLSGPRPELSKKNRYHIPKQRYYELKHFCLQYPVWRDKYVSISELSSRPLDKEKLHISDISDTTAKLALVRTKYRDLMDLLESTARETDQELASYIVKAVTEGYTYETLKFSRSHAVEKSTITCTDASFGCSAKREGDTPYLHLLF